MFNSRIRLLRKRMIAAARARSLAKAKARANAASQPKVKRAAKEVSSTSPFGSANMTIDDMIPKGSSPTTGKSIAEMLRSRMKRRGSVTNRPVSKNPEAGSLLNSFQSPGSSSTNILDFATNLHRRFRGRVWKPSNSSGNTTSDSGYNSTSGNAIMGAATSLIG